MEEVTESEQIGCRFRFGISCTDKFKCDTCGFNPKEEALRTWTINHQLKHRAIDAPYRLRIFRNDGEWHE